MDAIDEDIIYAIDSGSIRYSRIAKKLGIPLSTVHFRVKRLERDGIIKGYRGDIDWRKAGLGLNAFVFINIDVSLLKRIGKTQDKLLKELLSIKYVREGYVVTGDSDILLRVMAKDTAHFKEILLNHIDTKEGIVKTDTIMILE
ncbi:MAG: Lrp/AsnC family transcriptional regulator [Candidatus Micrarchaeales archaeon]|jgi:DNA-binding Lrp family transcriptional regulator|uniref:Transcriptional regulator, AsnC family n=1 Tax=Candidatus Micrarchaeum acidiphilum ARMAN-2 TaxID=425595 RepID=C7DGD8_MICA2|nr:MAG: transcriptional regulator, AsnC family [Candidatus Micrarchaeum acidiphilum ARMAN-2]MCW6161121.1 Lrp/AsnC family transcriptional regulator [Candidatus Micrarchaeales archaeon]